MRVGLDMQLARGTATGIGEYALGLFAALSQRAADGSDPFGLEVVRLFSPALDPWRFDRRVLWDQVGLPLAARRERVDLVHCVSGTLPRFSHAALVATVHDVAWLRVQAHTRPYARAYFGAFSLARYRAARAIFVDSQFSHDELLAVAPDLASARVEVAYPGVAHEFSELDRVRDDAVPFVLAVGTVEPRKNLEVVVRALAAIPQVRLISVGPPTPYLDEVRAIARGCGVLDRVEFRGYVPRDEMLSLYARAAVAVAPSHYEGFGYAAAQALCAGVPLVAAAASSLPEIVGSWAPLVRADDVEGWIDALRSLVEHRDAAESHASGVRAAASERFAWRATAAHVAATYAEVMR
jgi:glycosyltransferase involved in cell wall biosynthesis